MKALSIGERVQIMAGIPSFWRQVGRIIQIAEPFVAESLKESCFFEMPLYRVKLDDGRTFRFRGRDLQPLK